MKFEPPEGYTMSIPLNEFQPGDYYTGTYRSVAGQWHPFAGIVWRGDGGGLLVASIMIASRSGLIPEYIRCTGVWRQPPPTPPEVVGDHPIVRFGTSMPLVRRAEQRDWFVRMPDEPVWHWVHSKRLVSWNELVAEWGPEYTVLFGTDPREEEQ